MKDSSGNIIQQKSYTFAVRIVKLYQYLCEKRKEFVISKQLLRSGTSIGANVEEAIGAQSRKDFISKLSISYKESREVHFWLRILKDAEYITEKMFVSFIKDVEEILKLLASILKTTKKNNS